MAQHEVLSIKHFNSKIERTDVRLLHSYFGKDILKRVRYGIQGLNENEVAQLVDHEFFDEMQNEFGVRPTREDYLKAMMKGASTQRYVIDKLGLPVWNLGLINNVNSPSESPYQNMKLLLKKDNEIAPLLRYQLSAQNLLMLISFGLDNRARERKLLSQLHNFINFTDTKLFSQNRIGEGEGMNIYSDHDDSNLTLRASERPINLMKSDTTRQKITPIRFRTLKINGSEMKVIFDSRKKEDSKSILKTLSKALKSGGGRINWLNEVTDLIGTKFVAVCGDIDDLIKTFEAQVNEYFDNPIIKVDDATAGFDDKDPHRGSSPTHNFKRRQIMIGENMFEVLFYTLGDWLNAEYHIGNKLPDGSYNGAAHSLYEIKRTAEGGEPIIPNEILNINFDEYVQGAYEKEVISLRNKNNWINK